MVIPQLYYWIQMKKNTISLVVSISTLLLLSACGGLPSACEKAWDKSVAMGKKQNPNLSSKMIEAGREDFERRVEAQGDAAEESCKRQLEMMEKCMTDMYIISMNMELVTAKTLQEVIFYKVF